jgi:hypothetical protein
MMVVVLEIMGAVYVVMETAVDTPTANHSNELRLLVPCP